MRVRLAPLLALALLAAPTAAAARSWDGAGRGVVEWTNGSDCPATLSLHLERTDAAWGWRATLRVVQEASNAWLVRVCLPSVATLEMPVSGSDLLGWRGELHSACGSRWMQITLPLPTVEDAPARTVAVAYQAQGTCVPSGLLRADALVALATTEV